jgi:hypothetical protein
VLLSHQSDPALTPEGAVSETDTTGSVLTVAHVGAAAPFDMRTWLDVPAAVMAIADADE